MPQAMGLEIRKALVQVPYMTEEIKESDKTKPTGGVAPFGYRWEGGMLVVDESEAPVRKLIYELFLKHQRKKTVADILNECGYRTRKGAKFSDTTIDRLIRDTTSKGIRISDERETIVDAIVDSDVWKRANNLLGKKVTKRSSDLFSGLVFCFCGSKMPIPSNQKKYVCSSCKHKIEVKIVKEAFLDNLEKFFAKNLEKISNNNEASNNQTMDYWKLLTKSEKRILTQNLINKITVETDTILITFGIDPNSFKAAVFGQQNPRNTKPVGSDRKHDVQPDQNEPLMSEAEAAKFLGISKMTLLRRRKSKKIQYYRVGFRILYSKEKHLLPFLEEREK